MITDTIKALNELYTPDVLRDGETLYKSVCGELADKPLFLNVAATYWVSRFPKV